MIGRKMSKKWLFLIGVIAFGLSYEWLKATFETPTFLIISFIYIVLLRILAGKFGK